MQCLLGFFGGCMAIKDIIAEIDSRIAKLQHRQQFSIRTVDRLKAELKLAEHYVDCIAKEIEDFEKTKKCLQDLQANDSKST